MRVTIRLRQPIYSILRLSALTTVVLSCLSYFIIMEISTNVTSSAGRRGHFAGLQLEHGSTFVTFANYSRTTGSAVPITTAQKVDMFFSGRPIGLSFLIIPRSEGVPGKYRANGIGQLSSAWIVSTPNCVMVRLPFLVPSLLLAISTIFVRRSSHQPCSDLRQST